MKVDREEDELADRCGGVEGQSGSEQSGSERTRFVVIGIVGVEG